MNQSKAIGKGDMSLFGLIPLQFSDCIVAHPFNIYIYFYGYTDIHVYIYTYLNT